MDLTPSLKESILIRSKLLSDIEQAWKLNRESPDKCIALCESHFNTCLDYHFQEEYASLVLCKGTAQIWISQYEEALSNIYDAIQIFEVFDNFEQLHKSYYSLGSCHYYMNNYQESLKAFFRSLKYAEKNGDLLQQAHALNGIGSVFYETEDFKESYTRLNQSLKMLNELGDETIKAKVLHGLSKVCYHQNKFDESQTYLKECIELSIKHSNSQVYIFAHEVMALIYKSKKDYPNALNYIDKAIDKAEKIGFKIAWANLLYLKGKIHLNQNNIQDAVLFFEAAEDIALEIQHLDVLLSLYLTLSEYFEQKGDLPLAFNYYKKYNTYNTQLSKQKHGLQMKSLEIQMNFQNIEKENEIYKIKNEELENRAKYFKEANDRIQTISKLGQEISSKLILDELLEYIYGTVNQIMQADILYIGLYSETKNQIEIPFYIKENQRVRDVVIPMEEKTKFTVWALKNNKEVLVNNFKKEAHKYVMIDNTTLDDKHAASLYIKPIYIKGQIIGVLGVHSYESDHFDDQKIEILRALAAYISIALDNAKIYKTLEDNKKLIEVKNLEILDSINYAKHLQDAILPNETSMSKVTPKHAMFYQPKDIVAGDFYWIKEKTDTISFAVADCTGHGVPGAMISVLCSNILDRAHRRIKNGDPAAMLDLSQKLISEQFFKDQEHLSDGMDIALCTLDKKERKLMYSGANNPIYLVRKKSGPPVQLSEVTTIGAENDTHLLYCFKSTRQSIGYNNGKPKAFKLNFIDLEKGDRIYMFSDGFTDQFGGPEDKKFNTKRFKDLILDTQKHEVQDHGIYFKEAFNKWKSFKEQIDDVCVFSLEF